METRFEVAKILTAHIEGVDGYGAARLAAKLGVTARTVQRWCANETRPCADELLDAVAAIGEDDAPRAAALWRALSGRVGQESRPAPRAEVSSSVEDGCLEVAAEAGDVSDALRRARSPESPGGRSILPSEAAEIASEAHDVEVASVCLGAAARGVPSPQLALSGARP
jgi:hypothetical protein